jgi:hypothetical protein
VEFKESHYFWGPNIGCANQLAKLARTLPGCKNPRMGHEAMWSAQTLTAIRASHWPWLKVCARAYIHTKYSETGTTPSTEPKYSALLIVTEAATAASPTTPCSILPPSEKHGIGIRYLMPTAVDCARGYSWQVTKYNMCISSFSP